MLPDAEVADLTILPHRSGAVRVLIDAEPQGDTDLWGARIGRLTGDPVLPCTQGGPAVATVDSEAPDHFYVRPREGVAARDLSAAIEAAQRRLPDVDRIETGGSIVRLYLRKPTVRLREALCEVLVPGTGPFRKTKPLLLERVRGEGVPAIELIVEPDPVRALVRLRHFEADILARLPESYWPDQAEAPQTRRAFTDVRTMPDRLSYLVWNLRRSPVSELEVRQALSESLDREKLARDLHHGLAEPAQPGIAFDRAAAAKTLEDAGWLDKGAVRQREGRLLRLTILAAKEGHGKRFVAAWRDALRKLGVELEASPADGQGFLSRLREGSFDVALVERVTPPGRDLTGIVGSRGGENFGGIHSTAIDAALAAFRAGQGDETAVWQATLAEVAITPLFRRGEIALVSRALDIRPGAGWLDLTGARWLESDRK